MSLFPPVLKPTMLNPNPKKRRGTHSSGLFGQRQCSFCIHCDHLCFLLPSCASFYVKEQLKFCTYGCVCCFICDLHDFPYTKRKIQPYSTYVKNKDLKSSSDWLKMYTTHERGTSLHRCQAVQHVWVSEAIDSAAPHQGTFVCTVKQIRPGEGYWSVFVRSPSPNPAGGSSVFTSVSM